jgi:hypothetical protein
VRRLQAIVLVVWRVKSQLQTSRKIERGNNRLGSKSAVISIGRYFYNCTFDYRSDGMWVVYAGHMDPIMLLHHHRLAA